MNIDRRIKNCYATLELKFKIVSFYFSKDILKKEEIKLDWNFKWSMLNDLVRVCSLI